MLLDRSVLEIGTVIPQNLWIPTTVTDRKRHVQDAVLQMPIFFLHTDGRLGLTLDAAVVNRCDTLLNSQSSAPLGSQMTTHIRIGVSEHFLSALLDFQLLMRFRDSYSGVVIASSSDKFKSVTKSLSTIPSLSPSLRST
jgi:hypothetical protein